MHAEDFVVDQSCDGKTVEAVSEDLPQFYTMASLTLIVEAIDPVDGGTLMVTTQKEEVLWILDFVGK